MDIDELYQNIILDHSKRPRNFGELPPPAAKGEGYNPSCGDEVTIFLNKSAAHTVVGGSFRESLDYGMQAGMTYLEINQADMENRELRPDIHE